MKKIICLFMLICVTFSCRKNETVTGTITGIVFSSADVISSAIVELLDSKSDVIQSVLSDSKGKFIFTNVRVGKYSVEVSKDRYSTQSKSIQVIGGTLNLTIDLQKTAASVQGKVKNQLSVFLEAVTVILLQNSTQVKQTTTDVLGNFIFYDIPYGTYHIKFEKAGYSTLTQNLEISANTAALNVTLLTKKGDLTVFITDNYYGPLKNATISLKQNSTTIATSYSGDNGSSKFSSISIGTYTIDVNLQGFITQTKSADLTESGTTVRIKLTPESGNSGGILSAKVISFTSTSAVFEMDVFVTTGQSTPYTGLLNSSFTIESFTNSGSGLTYTFVQNSFLTTNSPNNGPYSAGMLIDQSGSISWSDPNNTRIQAAKIFLSSMKNGDNASLAAFSSFLSPIPVVYGSGFTSSGSPLFPYLDEMANNSNGGTPLYQAIYNMITYTSTNAPNSNKAVIVFTDGEDTDGGITIDEIVALSASTNVKVYTVGFSSAVNIMVLGEIASRTGGAFMVAGDTKELVSMYGNLGNILEGSAYIYRMLWTVYVSGGIAFPGTSLSNNIKVTTPTGTFNIPFYISPSATKSGNSNYKESSTFKKRAHIDY